MQIIPGILTDNIEELGKRVEMAVRLVEWVQIDFIDGEYADNRTVRPGEVDLRKFQANTPPLSEAGGLASGEGNFLKFEAHLMVSQGNMSEWLREALEAGFDRITAQVESVIDQKAYVEVIKTSKKEVGLSLDSETKVEVMGEEILKELDVVQVMTIKAGFSGQKLIPDLLKKVRQLKKIKEEKGCKFLIEVDGGVNLETIKMVKEEGVDLAEVNSGLYKDGPPSLKATEGRASFEENLKELMAKI